MQLQSNNNSAIPPAVEPMTIYNHIGTSTVLLAIFSAAVMGIRNNSRFYCAQQNCAYV